MKYGKLTKPIFKRLDKRGIFVEVINFGKWENLISGKMKKGAEMGNHYHKLTTVFFYLLSGKAKIKTLNLKTSKKSTNTLLANQGYLFKPEEVRIIKYSKTSNFLMMKSKKFNPNNPDLIDYRKKF